MTGVTATGDPATDPRIRVTGIYVQDPWYPRVSSIWGPGQRPNSYITRNALRPDFLPRRGGRRHADQAGLYVLVLPVAEVATTSANGSGVLPLRPLASRPSRFSIRPI
jgi:hypothetical protein